MVYVYLPRQITQAQGWRVVFFNEDDPTDLIIDRVTVWAACVEAAFDSYSGDYIIEENSEQILGYSGGDMLEPCDEMSNFLCYCHEDDLEDQRTLLIEEAQRYARAKKARQAREAEQRRGRRSDGSV